MMRKSGQLDAALVAVHSASKGDTQNLRCFDRIHTHALVEVTDTEKKNRIGMFLLHLPVLLHQRGIRYTLRLFYLIFYNLFCRPGRWRLRRGRCETPIIIEVQIEAQFQRLIECLSHIGGNTIDTTFMLVDDSRFAELVSGNLCLRADNILRECRKIFIIRGLGVTVNN